MITIPDSTCSQIISYKDMQVQILNNGKSVQLVKGNQEFTVLLNEQDASAENQTYINLKPDDLMSDSKYQLKYLCDPANNISTKVMFFKDQQGIAIKWSNQLKTLFTFAIDE